MPTKTQPMDRMTVHFPDAGKQVAARYGGFEILTDQPVDHDGAGAAPAPFDLFLASLAACAGFYVREFCRVRDIPLDGLELEQSWTRDPDSHRVTAIEQRLTLPPGFPEKYEAAVVRAAQSCTVKRLLADPPPVTIRAERSA